MFKVILLSALVSAAWTEGYPKVSYESDIEGNAGLIDEDDLRPQYRRQPVYQTQVEYNDENDEDGLTYDQKTSDSYPKAPSASSGYHKPGKQGTYKGSDITHEVKHKKQSYETTKVSQEHVEVKSVSNEYGTRIPSHGKKEPSKTYKSPEISQEEYKSPSDEKNYSGHIGQANKAPEYKPTYKKAEAPVQQQDNVEVDFKSPLAVKTAYRPPIQPGLSSGMRPGHYGHQGETYNGYSVYNNKKPYENRPPVQTYGVYKEGQTSAGGSAYHGNLGGSGVEYPGIGSTGSVPPPVSSYRPPSPPVSYRPPAPVSSYRPPSPPVSYRPPAPVSSYRPPSPPVSYRPPAPVSSYRPPSPPVSYRPPAPVSSYRPPSPPVSYRPPTSYSPNNRGYAPPANIGTSYHQTTRTSGHNSGSNRNYNHGGYQNHGYSSRPQAPSYKAPSYPKPYEAPSGHSIKSHSVKTPYSSGIKTYGYPASQSGVLSAGKASVKTTISSGSHYPKPSYPPTKISQEQHVDDHTKGGYHHPKPSYPQTKISQEQHADDHTKGGYHHPKPSYPQTKISQEQHADDHTKGGYHHPKPSYPQSKISQEKHADDHTKGGYHHPKPSYPPTKISQEQHADDHTKGGYHHPKPNYPPTKINQEKHSDAYPSVKGGNHHSKANYPQPKPIFQDKEEYPTIAEAKPQSTGIGESGYIGQGEPKSDVYKPKYPASHGVKGGSYEPKYPASHGVKGGSYEPKYPASHGVKGGSYEPKYPASHGVKGGSYEPKYPASHGAKGGSYEPKYPASHGVKGGSYEPKEYSGVKSASSSGSNPSVSSGYKAPTGHSIKGGSGVKGASYEDKKSPSKYLPITAVSSGSSAPSYKPVNSGHKYEPPKVEQAELSYESLLGGHGSQSPGAGSGGYGGLLSSGNPSGAAGGSGYGSYEEPSKPMPYEFKYEIKDDEHGSDHYREEKMDDNGYLTGRYGYMDPHGLFRMVEYQADKDGFKVNHVKTNEPGTDNQDPADVHFEVEKHGQY